MSDPRRPTGPRRLAGVLTGVTCAVVVVAGCDSGPGDTAPASTRVSVPSTGPGATGSTGPTGSTGTPTASSPGATASATDTPATSGPATPTASPGTFAIAVAGAGQVGYPVSGVTCTGTTVVATATPTGGGTAGTVTLDTATGAVTVAGLPPLDGTRLTGSTAGTPGPGDTVTWTGDGTGSAASLTVTCP